MGRTSWVLGSMLMMLLARPVDAQVPSHHPAYLLLVASRGVDQTALVRFSGGAGQVDHRTYLDFATVEAIGPSQLVLLPDRRGYLLTTQHGFPYGELARFAIAADSSVNEHQPPDTLEARIPEGSIASVRLTGDGAFAWLTVHGGPDTGSTISAIYLERMAEVARVPACAGAGDASFSGDRSEFLVLCSQQDALVAYATSTMLQSRSLPLATASQRCAPSTLVVAPDSVTLYVACGGSHELLTVDLHSWTIARRASAPAISALAITADGRTLVAAAHDHHAVELRDPTSGTVRFTIATDSLAPAGIALSADDKYAFVAVSGTGIAPGEVWMIDLTTGTRVASVEVGAGAMGIAFWKMIP